MQNKKEEYKIALFTVSVMTLVTLFFAFIYAPYVDHKIKTAVIKKQTGTFQCSYKNLRKEGINLVISFIFDEVTVKGVFKKRADRNVITVIKSLCKSNTIATVYYRYYKLIWLSDMSKLFERLETENGLVIQVIAKSKKY